MIYRPLSSAGEGGNAGDAILGRTLGTHDQVQGLGSENLLDDGALRVTPSSSSLESLGFPDNMAEDGVLIVELPSSYPEVLYPP